MLVNISLKDFALIDKLEIEFFNNFNTLTGETGAGKSILIDAVSLCIGGRANTSYIRSGSEKCSVIATFDITKTEVVKDKLAEYGYESDNFLIIEREISRNGRNVCRINGKISPVKILNEIGSNLINIYGQHEHAQLLDDDYQLYLIDSWNKQDIINKKSTLAELITEINSLKKRLSNIGNDQSIIARELDMLEFQINEIEEANLSINELEELENESMFLKNSEKIFSVLNEIENIFSNNFEMRSLFEQLGDITRDLENISSLDSELKPVVDMTNSIYYDMQELENITQTYKLKFDFDPNRLNHVEDRLNKIHTLRRKYGNSIEEILNYLKSAHERVYLLKNSEEERLKINKKIKSLKEQYLKEAKNLSNQRQNNANEFSKLIEKGIKNLGMNHARLKIDIIFDENKISTNGSDKINMQFSANKGEPVKPLSEVISGGELSRLMLEIKTQITSQNDNKSIIFDEIDVGIGGKVANAVADKIENLSKDKQVLCVTHLPVIAAKAKYHYVVDKEYVNGRTVTTITRVDGEDRIAEIMRMLGADDEITKSQAIKMLSNNN
ncbi:MAG: DNA repair protein RecN [Clostridia bacterium]